MTPHRLPADVFGRIPLVITLSAGLAFAQTTLSVSSGTGTPGARVSLNITLNTAVPSQVAGVQWKLNYTAADFTAITVTTGAAAAAAGKSATCSSTTPGVANCIVTGLNRNTIGSGVIATAALTVAPAPANSSSVVSATGSLGATATGTGMAVSGGSGTVVLSLPCSYSISPASASAASIGGTGRVAVTAGAGCSWTASSSALWIAVTAGASGSGNGTVSYSVTANTGTSTRTGTLTVAGRTFTVTQSGATPACSYRLSSKIVSLSGRGGTGTIAVTAAAGCGWTAASNTSWITIVAGASGSGNGTVAYAVAANSGSRWQSGTITVAGQTVQINQAGRPLRFMTATPCRVADTRRANGPLGGPSLIAGSVRDFPIAASPCGVPANADAYSLNVTAIPLRPSLGFLTIWPTGQSRPMVSSLNSSDGRIKADAVIVAAGAGGSASVYVSDASHVVLDISGYFVPESSAAEALAFYPVSPCRLMDTRQPPGTFGGPALAGGRTRAVPVLSGVCGIPATAQAYSMNFTAVPRAPRLGFLSVWPSGRPWPGVSTVNAPTGRVTANAAIISAGDGGSITVMGTQDTDLVIDLNGYFAPPGASGLAFYAMMPCRVVDTRWANVPTFGAPALSGKRTFPLSAGACQLPAQAAYVLNATVVPPTPLGFLTLWPAGLPQPGVSTLNALDGTLASNLAVVPATNGSISAYATSATELILDLSGYFSP